MNKLILKEFNNYVKQFDLKEPNIMRKFHHTYRVIDFAKGIAESLDLSKEDIEIAELCALLHDIARFKQFTEYKTYKDLKSFDHGDVGCEILLENNFIEKFTNDNEVKNLILKSIKNHNKFKIEEGLTDREILFSNIVRDADKLDILIEQYSTIKDDSNTLKQELLDNITNKRLCEYSKITNSIDGIIGAISYVFDINYKYTFEVLLDKKIIENKFNVLKIYTEDNRLEELEKEVIEYMKERIKC